VKYVCANCGQRVEPLASRPSIDTRYALGFCDTKKCRRVVKGELQPNDLVRQDVFDLRQLDERKRQKEDQRLARRYMNGELNPENPKHVPLIERARAVLDEQYRRMDELVQK
jgi:DNA-directed RNA polymerase subunit RPC12/RpoP